MFFSNNSPCTHNGFDLPQSHPSALYYKTRLCNEYMKTGTCSRKDACTYAHGDEELRPNQDYKNAKSSLFKTKLCQNFLNGSCRLSSNCSFAHGFHELRYTNTCNEDNTNISPNYTKNTSTLQLQLDPTSVMKAATQALQIAPTIMKATTQVPETCSHKKRKIDWSRKRNMDLYGDWPTKSELDMINREV